MPAADEDLLDEQAHESLSTFEVKGVDPAGSSLQIGQFHETDLVEVGETTRFCGGRLELALEPGELGAEQLVVGCRTVGGECARVDEEHVRSQQCSPHLVEDEGIELVSSDVALRATAVLAA